MWKKITVALMTVGFMASFSVASYAMEGCSMGGSDNQQAQASEVKDNAVKVGNTACPVTGEAVDNNTTYAYKGKIYNFCCPMCIPKFKKDPETYIKKILS